MAFLDYLTQQGIITNTDALAISKEAAKGAPLEEVLVKHGIEEAEITKLKGTYLNIPVKELESGSVPFEVLKYIPEESALHYGFVPLELKDGVLEVGMIDPDDIEARDALQFISSQSGVPFKFFLISRPLFQTIAANYKGLGGEVHQALSQFETGTPAEGGEKKTADSGAAIIDVPEVDTEMKKIGIEKKSVPSGNFEAKIIEDAPVTKIVAVILRNAVEGNASDVHIEPVENRVRVRFRVDGILNTSLFLPKNVHSAVVARVKILSNMRLDEKRKPQDGRFSARIENRLIDFRVSTFPTYYGEKVVMRILDPQKGFISLGELGMSEHNLSLIKEAIDRPYGMILLTGPTGSGKTTTMYSMMNELDMEKSNVLSLEDPVEYNISGMNQSQMMPEIGYDFANGLRTTLRQDPDVIMVGEIRDKETAQLAVQAALTGHLVISTLHTNNAVGVIPRLIDMGVDPYLIAPTLVLAIAQRLVRKLCPGPQKSIPIEGSIKIMIEKEFAGLPEEFKKNIPKTKEVYEAMPSDECPSGMRGRAAVFEMFMMNKDIEKIVLGNPTESALFDAIRKQGMFTMREDALTKAFRGEIPFGEVNKV
ncbi:MAG: Flp pilus assembly complex ATPase component TadA [Candidatus Lloydbacteria bacterium]|nr:Flp pilus assembly complex ATPase component TadA [Candidatus Lloydbacteria bacterium]